MSLFESIINETRQKFNLGENKANVLLSVLLGMITDKSRGGLSGFLEGFNRAGLSGVASSWVTSDANTHISGEQLESTFGEETIRGIAGKIGTDYQTAISAVAFMLPHVVNNLTPDGVLPADDDLLSRTGAYLTSDGAASAGTGTGNAFDRIGTSATNIIEADRNDEDILGIFDAPRPIAQSAPASIEEISDYEDNSPLRWLLPLIILGLLIVLGFWFCGASSEHKSANINTGAIYST